MLGRDSGDYPVYEITFRVEDFEKYESRGTHVHFYWDTPGLARASSEAGSEAFFGEPLELDGKPWIGFTPDGAPEGSKEICVVVAIQSHRIVPGTGNCFPIPGAEPAA